jgi:DNA mismatch endonuclease (patch repair protein)
MVDVFSKAKRSDVMSRIRGRGNKETEQLLAKLFRTYGITGWRRRQAVFGKPDFVFRAQRIAVFVDGCFWHLCPKHSNMPANNRDFWKRKLEGNRKRDQLVTRTLKRSGWRVIRIWEHDLRKADACIQRLRCTLRKQPI